MDKLLSLLGMGLLCTIPIGKAHSDWPHFLGPTGDLHAPALALGAPKSAWQVAANEGFSGPVTANGKAFLYGRSEKNEFVRSFDLATGKTDWQQTWPAVYEDNYSRGNGPRATPVCHQGLVIVMGPEGTLRALSQESGVLAWKWNLPGGMIPRDAFFGYGFSPAIIQGKLWINPGVEDLGIVALDPKTGKILHQVPGHKAGYSTPIPWTIGGKVHGAFITREGFSLVDATTAEVIHRIPFRARSEASVNAASPVKIGQGDNAGLFLTACYSTGGYALLGAEKGAKTLWKNDSSLSSHFATPIYHKGHLYGFHGRQEEGAQLRCVEAETGLVKWTEDSLGCGWVILCGEEIVVVAEDGNLTIAPATPMAFRPRHNSKPFVGPVRAAPAADRGLLLVRDAKSLHAMAFGPK